MVQTLHMGLKLHMMGCIQAPIRAQHPVFHRQKKAFDFIAPSSSM